ncbi:putative oxidoreductase YmfI [Pullulanibacillus camelliae]|uniref:Putative oxidoreductase YmfI n=1 Tax=Pullulanibacillus camelliae TaxID=1707096 RepID=A0A8J3DUJ0_9BACL|nr:SDR family NAD(P)-dependent oxidoreductase [Pullulanibacillus camelliae]GGE46041.1 putative oxidoreductase YmfI [Pullulanibacillus camelliae]
MEKYALITGASGGIGREISKALAKSGFSIFLHYYQNTAAIESLSQELMARYPDQEFITLQADLSQDNGWHLLKEIDRPIDCLIHNCGRSHVGLITDVTKMTLEKFITLNITNPFLITQELLPQMIRNKRGKIIFITSIWGIVGSSMEVLYSTMKGAQNSFVKALARELAPSHINVNAVAPGAIETEMMEVFDEETKQLVCDDIPAGRFGQPEEVGALVDFLVSDQADYINGQVISINGAWQT